MGGFGWDGVDGVGAVGGEVDEKMAAKPKLRLAGMVLSRCQARTPGAGRRLLPFSPAPHRAHSIKSSTLGCGQTSGDVDISPW